MRFIFSIIIVSGFCFHCFAETTPETAPANKTENEKLEYVETIEVSAKRSENPLTITELPAFVTTIEIDQNIPRFQTLPELLSSAVGVTIKDFGGLGKLSTISIRGSSANQVLVLLDGVRINTASDSGVDLSTLPLNNIEKVEILRGADSAVFGSGAMGGVVNLITRKTGDSGVHSLGSVTYGSYNTTDVDAGVWFNTENGRYRINTSYQHSDGDYEFLNNNGTEFNLADDFDDSRINNDVDAHGASIWFSRSALTDCEFSGSADWYYGDKGIPGMITFPSPNATQTDRRLSGSLRFEKSWPGETGYRVFSNLSGKYIGLDFNDPLGEQTGVPIETRQRTTFLSGSAGFDTYYARGSSGIKAHFNSEQLDDRHFGQPDRDTTAVSINQELNLFNETVWVTGILRYDNISAIDDYWSPKLGVRWFLSDRLSIRANAGKGFRAPSFNELYMEAGFMVGSPDLMPEEALSYDIGISYDAENWRIEAAAFQIDSDDLIEYLLVSGFRYKPFNIGEARSRGIEIEGSVNPGAGFNLSGSYTWDEATDQSHEVGMHDKQIPGRPEHDLFGKLSWQNNSLNMWVEWHYLSGNFITRGNTKELDQRRLGNLGLSWKINNMLQIGAEVKNVTDDRVVDVRGFPLPPRTFFASVKMNI